MFALLQHFSGLQQVKWLYVSKRKLYNKLQYGEKIPSCIIVYMHVYYAVTIMHNR